MHKDILEKGFLKGDLEHTGSIQASPKKTTKTQALTAPQQEPNHSTKLRGLQL